jgi:MYXO-CTERM domain-containing protein
VNPTGVGGMGGATGGSSGGAGGPSTVGAGGSNMAGAAGSGVPGGSAGVAGTGTGTGTGVGPTTTGGSSRPKVSPDAPGCSCDVGRKRADRALLSPFMLLALFLMRRREKGVPACTT